MFLAASELATSLSQSAAERAQGDYQKQQFDTNARLAELQGEYAISQGEQAAQALSSQSKKLIGSQRAAFAAQGIEVSTGSAADIQVETAGQAALDVSTIRNNAWREAWGYRVQAQGYRAEGQQRKLASEFSANQTLLTGGLRAIKTKYDYSKRGRT